MYNLGSKGITNTFLLSFTSALEDSFFFSSGEKVVFWEKEIEVKNKKAKGRSCFIKNELVLIAKLISFFLKKSETKYYFVNALITSLPLAYKSNPNKRIMPAYCAYSITFSFGLRR